MARAYSIYSKLGRYENHLSYGVFESDDTGVRLHVPAGGAFGGKVEKLDTALIRERSVTRGTNQRRPAPLNGQTEPDPHKGCGEHLAQGAAL